MFASRMILPYLLRRRQQNCCAIAHCEKTERCSAHRLVQGLFSRLAATGCERYGRDGRSMTWCTAEIMVEVKPSGERAYRHSPRTQMAPTDPLEPRDAPTHLPRSLASNNAPRCPTCSVIMRVRLLFLANMRNRWHILVTSAGLRWSGGMSVEVRPTYRGARSLRAESDQEDAQLQWTRMHRSRQRDVETEQRIVHRLLTGRATNMCDICSTPWKRCGWNWQQRLNELRRR